MEQISRCQGSHVHMGFKASGCLTAEPMSFTSHQAESRGETGCAISCVSFIGLSTKHLWECFYSRWRAVVHRGTRIFQNVLVSWLSAAKWPSEGVEKWRRKRNPFLASEHSCENVLCQLFLYVSATHLIAKDYGLAEFLCNWEKRQNWEIQERMLQVNLGAGMNASRGLLTLLWGHRKNHFVKFPFPITALPMLEDNEYILP